LSGQLLVNLSFLASKPTGHTVYAKNLLTALESLNPILLTGKLLSNFRCYQISDQLTPDQGTKGHFSRLLWNQFSLPKIYKELKANLLFSPIPEAPLSSNCRFVVTLHDLIPLRFPRRTSPLTSYFRYYIPQVLKQAEHVLCDSEATANDAFNFYQISHRKMTVVPISYDEAHFRFLDLPTQNYFLYVGRHDPYKNLERLIAAFATLPDQEYELWIAGSPDDRYTPILLAQAKALGVANRVKFLSYVPYAELPSLLNGAIALVFPSLWEGFGLPVLEAMACGTPVITSNLSSIPEVAGDAAILIDPYDLSAIADAMHKVTVDSGLRAQLNQKGRDRATQFSWQKTSATTADILRQYL
jgi:glycosyltransferase involved in cell wall biosynthesis